MRRGDLDETLVQLVADLIHAPGGIESLELPGVYFLEEPSRIYPSGTLAAHLLGFVRTDDNEGLEGVEFAFNDLLRGRPGELLVERAASGGVIIPLGEYDVVPPRRGRDLVLSPAQDGKPLLWNPKGYAEIDGKPVKVARKHTYTEVK